MQNSILIPLLRTTLAAISMLSLVGCATDGYISSNITTGIGLDVSGNPQTQIPQVRFGYIRNGLYYIPTGKTGNPQGDASQTPHVVSKIHVGSEFLKNIDISEKFAVGDAAVNSNSAKQLFADTSTETRGQIVQAPQVATGDGLDNRGSYDGPIDSHVAVVTPPSSPPRDNVISATKLHRDANQIDEEGSKAIIAVAGTYAQLQSLLTANPQGDNSARSYLGHLIEQAKHENDEQAALKALRAIIPANPARPIPQP